MRERPTGEEGLHGGTLGQLDRRLSRVSGQSRVCAVVQEQPDYRKVVARYGIMERPEGKTHKKRQFNTHRSSQRIITYIPAAKNSLFLLCHFQKNLVLCAGG